MSEVKTRKIKSTDPVSVKSIDNINYCVAFLKNSGERVRAIRLYMDFTGCTSKQAIKHVDYLTFKVPLSHRL